MFVSSGSVPVLFVDKKNIVKRFLWNTASIAPGVLAAATGAALVRTILTYSLPSVCD